MGESLFPGKLEAIIVEDSNEIVKVTTARNKNSLVSFMRLEIRRREYQKIKRRGSIGVHEGYRHTSIIRTSHINFDEKNLYNELKRYESQLK